MSKVNPKENIITVAESIMLKKGVSETSIQDICAEVGISKGTLYYHFASKGEIVLAVADNYFKTVDASIDGLIQSFSRHENIEEVLVRALQFFYAKSSVERMHYLLMAYAITSDESLRARIASKYDEWRNMIKGALDGVSEEDTNAPVAEILLAIVDGLAIKNILGMDSLAGADVRTLVRKFEFMKNLF